MARNAIARETGVSASTVSKIAAEAGVAFDRSMTAAAVEAHRVDLAESRQLLAEKMMRAAHSLVDSIGDPYEVFNFGGKDNTFNSHRFDKPPVEVQRNILTTAGIAFDKATRILEKAPEADTAAEVRDAVLGFAMGLKGLFGNDDTYGQVTDDSSGTEHVPGDGEPRP